MIYPRDPPMRSPRDPGTIEQPLARFLERVRHSFSHDLRTPLGTIVNYAAILEANPITDPEEVRDLGHRIRTSAQRVAHMVQLLATATGLASRPLRPAPTDLVALARSVLMDAGGRGDVGSRGNGQSPLADVDAEVLGFAWRAYAAVENDSLGKPINAAVLHVLDASEQVILELHGGSARAEPALLAREDAVDLASYLRHNGGPARLETSLGLGLAQELVFSHGGDLQVWGRPGSHSGLRVRIPCRA